MPYDELPDLDPMLLLSESAQREVLAAQANAPLQPELASFLEDANLFQERNQELDAEISFGEPEPEFQIGIDHGSEPSRSVVAMFQQGNLVGHVDLSEIWGGVDREGSEVELPTHAQAPQVEPDLTDLFMNREAQEAAAALGRPTTFVNWGLGEGGMSPGRPLMGSSSGSSGEVVRRRVASGRFEPVERSRPPALVQTTPTYPNRSSVRSSETTRPQVQPSSGPRRTLMQHLLSDD